MAASHSKDDDFLTRVTAVVKGNLANERFGVSELADEMHMSRSNLLRRVRQSTNRSASQFIREIRLKRGMELLEQTSLTVSEVSHQVGFGGASYFIKCFREYYGYPPGEAGRRKPDAAEQAEASTEPATGPPPNTEPRGRWMAIAVCVAIAAVVTVYLLGRSDTATTLEKSIAVLPFKNDSDDSSNVYLINGVMEATLNNLQKIKDLRVISRTSSEKYRGTTKSIPELATALNVRYCVEGSGQKVGNRILLNIQLIDAHSDRHLWARRYEREVTDLFQLQQDIAKDIAKEVRAVVTWEETKRIEKIPTDDMVAYDLLLRAADLLRQGGNANLNEAIALLKQATEQDPDFALAHALTSIAYYYLDAFQQQRRYVDTIGIHADRALLYDPASSESLFAKGLHYVNKKEYESALPYLEKALDYNPNSALVIHFLSDFYNWHVPNTAKYLEYALQGIRLEPTAYDSATTSFNYLHLSNALVQTGFIDESLRYIEQSMAYNPGNAFAHWVHAVVVYAKYGDSKKTEKLLLAQLAKDSSQMHILQELGKFYFHGGDDRAAFRYYQRFMRLRDAQALDFFRTADLDMAILWSRKGEAEKSEACFARFKAFADADASIYKNMHLALYHAYKGDASRTIEHLRLFAKEDNFQYWVLLFKDDVMVAPFAKRSDFKRVMGEIEAKFWRQHADTRKMLEEKGLL